MAHAIHLSPAAITAAKFWGDLLRDEPRYTSPEVARQFEAHALTHDEAVAQGLVTMDAIIAIVRGDLAELSPGKICAFERALAGLIQELFNAGEWRITIAYSGYKVDADNLLMKAAEIVGDVRFGMAVDSLFPHSLNMEITAESVVVSGSPECAAFQGEKPLIDHF